MKMNKIALAFSLALTLLISPADAVQAEKDPAKKANRKEKRKKSKKAKLKDEQSVTKHSVTIDGEEIAYTATAGTLVLKDEDGDPRASVFYIAYTRDGVEDPTSRPITFTFNGGPGSSSVWLHMGAFGPRRVKMGPEGEALPPPYELVNNDYSLLDLTDMVFIDPVSTGYSRAAEDVDPKEFHGVKEDIESVGEFIRLYTTRNERWGSPKFLAGESYGTTRAAGLAGHLQSRHGMYLNGIVLVSSILNFGTARFDRGNDLPFILFLPTYTATAWFHQKLPGNLQSRSLADAVAEAREFARTDYTLALMQGDKLDSATRDRIAQRLVQLTGLSREYVEQTNLRIYIHRFVKELLREDGATVGRFDSRLKGTDYDNAGEEFDYDPSYAVIQGVYSTMFKDYVRRTLGFKSDLPYEILTGRVRPWNYGDYENQYINVAETLRKAIAQNPSLRVIVANGYYDLATPFYATEYTMDHLGLPAARQGNVALTYYEAGHMMYIRETDHRQLREDLAGFYNEAPEE